MKKVAAQFLSRGTLHLSVTFELMKPVYYAYMLAIATFLSSCGTFIYRSPTARTPLFDKANDLHIQANASSAGGELYAGYAVLNNLAVSAAVAGAIEQSGSDTNINKRNAFRDLEFSAIPFFATENIRLEMPLGFGTMHRRSTSGSYTAYNPYQRLYIQPTFGTKLPNFDFAAFVRISQISYYKTALGKDIRYEPGMMIRGGSENFKVMFQVRLDYGTNYSKTPASGLPISDQAEYFPIHFSFGLNIHFNTMEKKK